MTDTKRKLKRITKIGTFDEEGLPTGWHFDRSDHDDYPTSDVKGESLYGGRTIRELKRIYDAHFGLDRSKYPAESGWYWAKWPDSKSWFPVIFEWEGAYLTIQGREREMSVKEFLMNTGEFGTRIYLPEEANGAAAHLAMLEEATDGLQSRPDAVRERRDELEAENKALKAAKEEAEEGRDNLKVLLEDKSKLLDYMTRQRDLYSTDMSNWRSRAEVAEHQLSELRPRLASTEKALDASNHMTEDERYAELYHKYHVLRAAVERAKALTFYCSAEPELLRVRKELMNALSDPGLGEGSLSKWKSLVADKYAEITRLTKELTDTRNVWDKTAEANLKLMEQVGKLERALKAGEAAYSSLRKAVARSVDYIAEGAPSLAKTTLRRALYQQSKESLENKLRAKRGNRNSVKLLKELADWIDREFHAALPSTVVGEFLAQRGKKEKKS